MTDENTGSNTEETIRIGDEGIDSPDASTADHIVVNSVVKMLLGVAPGDPITTAVFLPDISPAQLDLVRSFLSEQPELDAALALEVEEAWDSADGQREAFIAALAERRAEILSRAELSHLRRQIPRAVAGFRDELTRYLIEMEGFSAGNSDN